MKKKSVLSLSLLASLFGIACGGSTDAGPAMGDSPGAARSPGAPGSAGVTPAHGRAFRVLRDEDVAPASLPRFYVSADGDDGNDCSQDAPCRQVTRALAFATRAGGRVEVGDGSFAGFKISKYPGTAAAPLVVEATGDGAEIEPGEAQDTIYVDRSDYVTLKGLHASNAPRAAVRISGSNFARVEDGVFGNNGRWGIFTDFSDDTTLVGNEIFGSEGEHGIYVSNSGDRPRILSNNVYGNNQSGIQINADYETQDDYGIYRGVADGLCTGALIEDNYVYSNGSGGAAAINLDGVQDSIVRNNVLHDNAAAGIVMYGDADGVPGDGLDGGDGFDGDGQWGPSGMLVEYNTILMASGSRTPIMIRYSHGDAPNVVRDNIFASEGDDAASMELGSDDDVGLLASDHNVLSTVGVGDDVRDLSDWRDATGQDAHSLVAAPSALFVDPSAGDFRLADGSPAVGVGSTDDGSPDVSGASRASGSSSDIGAFQNR